MLNDPAHAFMPYPPVAVPNAGTGSLAGLTFAVKDLFDVAGYPTSAGNPMWLAMSGIKTSTAPTVQRLLDHGARFVGKVITDEMAFSMNGQNAHFGSPINGAAPDRITGGSSCGSAAAVSNHLCDVALGTDTGGSVRAPANHCGLYGIRPSHGRVSLQSAADLSPSFDTCGWFSRDIHTFARVADVLIGNDANDISSSARLLVPTDAWALLSEPVQLLGQTGIAQLQALFGSATNCTVAYETFDAMYWHFRYLQGREAWGSDGAFITRYAPPLGPGVKERFEWSSKVTDEQVLKAQQFRQQFRVHMNGLLGSNGVMILPTMPDIAPLRTASESSLEDYRNKATQMLCIAGLAGLPQLSIPMFKRDGAPLGLSLLGPVGSDRSLIAIAEKLASTSTTSL